MKYLILTVFALCLCSCATSLSSNETSVIIDSIPSGEKFIITNSKGKVVHNGITPETVMLDNSTTFFEPEIHKVSTNGNTVNIEGKMTAIYFGNIFGLIGFIVDPITGNMWNLPDEVIIENDKAKTTYSVDTVQ